MPFGASLQRETTQSDTTTQAEQIYFRIPPESVLRILDEQEVSYWRYYVYVNVGGKQQQRSIVVGPGNTPFKERYGNTDIKPSKRMLLNILDRTIVKKLADGTPVYQDAGGKYPPTAGNGENTAGLAETPNNKIYILDFGSEIMKKLVNLHRRVRNQKTFDPMNVWDFDIRLISTKTGPEAKDVSRDVIPDLNQEPLPEELKASLLKYDLSQAVHVMPDNAQERLLAGEDLLVILKELNWPRPQATIKL